MIKLLFDQTAFTFSTTSTTGIVDMDSEGSYKAELISIVKPFGTAYLTCVLPEDDNVSYLFLSGKKPNLFKEGDDPKDTDFDPGDIIVHFDEVRKYSVEYYRPDDGSGELSRLKDTFQEFSFEKPICISPAIMHIFLQFMDKLRQK